MPMLLPHQPTSVPPRAVAAPTRQTDPFETFLRFPHLVAAYRVICVSPSSGAAGWVEEVQDLFTDILGDSKERAINRVAKFLTKRLEEERKDWDNERKDWENERKDWNIERMDWKNVQQKWNAKWATCKGKLKAATDRVQQQESVIQLMRMNLHENPGPQTRTKYWLDQHAPEEALAPLSQDIELPQGELTAVKDVPEKPEKLLYGPVARLINAMLAKEQLSMQFEAEDTSNKPYLDSYKPDITVRTVSPSFIHKAYACTVIDLKSKTDALTNDGKGQVLLYLQRMLASQPHRSKFTALLSNIRENVFVEVTRNRKVQSGMDVKLLLADSFEVAMHYLAVHVVGDPTQHPIVVSFSPFLGNPKRHLGNTEKSLVMQFDWPKEQSPDATWFHTSKEKQSIAVKRTLLQLPELDDEIEILQQITQAQNACDLLPRLVYSSNDGFELAITPVGEPFILEVLRSNTQSAQAVLRDILDALIWLHRHRFVHRDLRWDNIIHDKGTGRAMLIDFGSAIETHPSNPKLVPYYGGYLCCPPELLGKDLSSHYLPKAEHDLQAYVLLVNALLFPKTLQGFHSARVGDPTSEESARLCELWLRLARSCVWAPHVRAACNCDVDTLSRLCDVFASLQTVPNSLLSSVETQHESGADESFYSDIAVQILADTDEELVPLDDFQVLHKLLEAMVDLPRAMEQIRLSDR